MPHSEVHIAILPAMSVLLLCGLAVALVVASVWRTHGRPGFFRGLVKATASVLVWAVPILVILAYTSRRVVRQLEHAPPHSQAEPDHSAGDEIPRRAQAPLRAEAESSASFSPHARVGEGQHRSNIQLHAEAVSQPPAGGVSARPAARSAAAPAKLPAWIEEAELRLGDTTLQVLSSQRFATVDEAEAQLAERAAAVLVRDFHKAQPAAGNWKIPWTWIREHAVDEVFVEPIDRDFGRVYREHVRLVLSPETRQGLYPLWREQIVDRRLMVIGGLVGLVSLMLGTSLAYFRLDHWTGGACRGRLKLAAWSLIAGGGVLVSLIA